MEGQEITKEHGGLQRTLGETGGHQKNQEDSQGAMRGHGENMWEVGAGYERNVGDRWDTGAGGTVSHPDQGSLRGDSRAEHVWGRV